MALPVIKSDLYTALLLSVIVTALVWLNTPVPQDQSVFEYTMKLLLRTFAISFVVIYAIFYFAGTEPKRCEDVIQNIIKSEPDF